MQSVSSGSKRWRCCVGVQVTPAAWECSVLQSAVYRRLVRHVAGIGSAACTGRRCGPAPGDMDHLPGCIDARSHVTVWQVAWSASQVVEPLGRTRPWDMSHVTMCPCVGPLGRTWPWDMSHGPRGRTWPCDRSHGPRGRTWPCDRSHGPLGRTWPCM